MKPTLGRLHVITDTSLQSRYTHADLTRLAIDGGADTIQFRQKEGSSLEMYNNAEAMMKICREAGITMIVNDRLDVALAVDADGVHLGQSDIPLPVARKLLGNEKLIGGSAVNFDELQRVNDEGADYVGYGPVFGTISKADPGDPKGISYMKTVAERSSIPVIAIGGIKLQHIQDLLSTGIHGIAVISAICCETDPTAATKAFIKAIGNARR
jgi:thiamine-phosphate pyrophosphorylase